MLRFGCDDTNGIVIGDDIEWREYYQFYSEKDGRLLFTVGYADNDLHAVELFWSKFNDDPRLCAQLKKEGIEMRCYND